MCYNWCNGWCTALSCEDSVRMKKTNNPIVKHTKKTQFKRSKT